MGNKYKRKTNRQQWPRESMTLAVQEVKNGAAVYATSKKYNLPEATLRRYAKKYTEETLPTTAGRFRCTFTDEQLQNLKEYVQNLNRRAFGLTREQFAKIAFDYAETLKIPHRFNKEKKKVGKDFIQSFKVKFNFSLRKPEATSAARLAACNKTNVEAVFNLYSQILAEKKYEPHKIYNVDETGCSTVPTKNLSVLSPKGNRRVIKLSSSERGVNVSVACCFNAIGHYVPPFFIFPRVRMQQHFMNNATPGSLGVCNESEWMNAETFIQWLEHFIKNVRPSKENPILLLMDNHTSHVTWKAVNLCRENHISLLGFPPHTSHRMQLLDAAFYGSLKTAYSRACDDYLMGHPGQLITIKDVAGLFNVAYSKVATISNAVKGFTATGLVPLNSQIFSDSDFEPSMITEIPHNASMVSMDETEVAGSCDASGGNADDTEVGLAGPSHAPEVNADETAIPGPSCVESSYFALLPLPNAAPKERKQRKKMPSLHITSSPIKRALENKQAEKKAKEKKKEENQKKRAEKQNAKKGAKGRRKKKCDKELFLEDSSDSSISVNYTEDDDDNDFVGEELCEICNDYGKSETWYSCSRCHKWSHAACTGLTEAEAKRKAYVCDFCA